MYKRQLPFPPKSTRFWSEIGDIGSGIGGKYSHRVWQQFWIHRPTSEKREMFTKILGPWASRPMGPGTLGPGCACAGNRRSPASRRKVRCQGSLGRSLSPSRTKTGFAAKYSHLPPAEECAATAFHRRAVDRLSSSRTKTDFASKRRKPQDSVDVWACRLDASEKKQACV